MDEATATILADEAFLMNAPKDTWKMEFDALAGTSDHPGEMGRRADAMAASSWDQAEPAVVAYYETVKARYDVAVRVGLARGWLKASDYPTYAPEEQAA